MEEKSPYSLAGQLRQIGARLLDAWQILVTIVIGLIVLVLLVDVAKLAAPDAPVLLFWASVGAGILLLLAHTPYAFHRWSNGGRISAYVAILPFLSLFFWTINEVDEAWTQTSQGAAEAKERQVAAQADAAAQEQAQRTKDAANQRQLEAQEAKETAEKLERCFTYFGHRLPKLEDLVRDSLGNPDSFKHVRTEATDPDLDGSNLRMTFMAQNRMGALWTYTIRATVDPDTCTITDETEPQPA